MRCSRGKAICVVIFLGWMTAAMAGSGDGTAPDSKDQEVMSSRTFLNAHPDLKYRTEGWLAYRDGRYEQARKHFMRAAGYADKLSQAMLAEMSWTGQGQVIDRAIGYAWADLAAERGYPQFVALREGYWRAMQPAERERALEVGQSLLDEYGDEVARIRINRHLRQARRHMLGGRVRKDIDVIVPGPSGQSNLIRGRDFYSDKFWQPAQYQDWLDETWNAPPRGTVEVGAPKALRPDE